MKRSFQNRLLRLVGVIAVVLGASSAAAFATGQLIGDGGVIQGCYRVAEDDRKGELRVVSTAEACRQNELAISWSQRGPEGAVGPTGSPGKDGIDGVSVTSTSLTTGDPNCPNGGSKFLAANASTTYACNGLDGAGGDRALEGLATTAIATVPLEVPPPTCVAGPLGPVCTPPTTIQFASGDTWTAPQNAITTRGLATVSFNMPSQCPNADGNSVAASVELQIKVDGRQAAAALLTHPLGTYGYGLVTQRFATDSDWFLIGGSPTLHTITATGKSNCGNTFLTELKFSVLELQ